MIIIKTDEQLELMRKAGRITGESILVAREYIKEGVSTAFIDKKMREYIEKCGAKPTFLGYGGFPATACISINEEVIHGIPSENRILKEGDIVKIDSGACWKGYTGDSANTFGVGKISDEAQRLIDVTKESFYKGIEQAKVGNRIGDIGCAIAAYAESFGYGVIREYEGHGVGRDLHEEPPVPNYGKPGRGPRLYKNMTIAVEPMITMGRREVMVLDNDWTVISRDRSLTAHYEHSIVITDGEPE